jgi:hypothetical protein
MVKLATALGTTPEALCSGISWNPQARGFQVEDPG